MGTGLFAAILQSAVPPFMLPVKPIALTDGSSANIFPTTVSLLFRLEKTPLGIPVLLVSHDRADAEAAGGPIITL